MLGFFKKKKNNDRRGRQARSITARVNISHSLFGTLPAITQDITDKGMFVLLKEDPRLPKGAHVRVQMPQSANPEIVFNMRVDRTTDEGIALVFVDYELNGERYKVEKLINELSKAAK